MVDVPLISVQALLLERDDMDAGVVQQLRTALADTPAQYQVMREAIDKLEERLAAGKGDAAVLSLKIGIASHLVGRMERAVERLRRAKGPLAQFYLGWSLIELGRHEEALAALDAAAKAGYAAAAVQLQRAAALRGLNRLDEAEKTLSSLDKFVQSSAEFLYQMGEVLETRGERGKAIERYEKAAAVDPRHGAALFKLAFHNDRAGNDEEAIALYERCLRLPPPRMGTLINLGLLYEDNERYNQSAYCFEQVLRKYGDHSRARLFLRDANASRTQFFDEDAERRSDVYNAILDTPVTDFELSVRSRNCLKKMNIRSLRDLVNVSEQHLLASKNFGETSLLEIKQMLAMKGLSLGQNLEKAPKKVHPAFNLEDYSPQEQALFNKPISELNFSVRSRKCMTRLGIATIGELVAHSGDELLECKNFGVTSLVEVREKLKTLGLKLRGD